jgi:hypothetical protein
MIGLITGAAALAAAGLMLRHIAPRPSMLAVETAKNHFPTVSGFNLNREEYILPRDLGGELNILFVPFLRHQQTVVDSWIPLAQELEASLPGIRYYELPTIDEMPAVSRMVVNEGMRAGIPDETARERTITLYLDTARFMQATGIASKNDVHVLLVDGQGAIIWRTIGFLTEEKGEQLRQAILGNR